MSDASVKSAKLSAPVVDRSMVVMDIISLSPAAPQIMAEYGLHCFSCEMGGSESLEDGCKIHGFDEDTIDALVEDLNDMILEQPDRPQEIIITTDAAKKLLEIAKEEGRENQGLAIVPDGSGGFCMEFCEEAQPDDHEFFNPEVPQVKCFASGTTLWRIGGAVIDLREGRFKLDLPEDGTGCCQGTEDDCGCK